MEGERFLSHFFEYCRQASEFVFQTKLKLLEESCLPIIAELEEKMKFSNDKNTNSKSNARSSHNSHDDDIFSAFLNFNNNELAMANSSIQQQKTKFVDEADMFVSSLYDQLPTGFLAPATRSETSKNTCIQENNVSAVDGEIDSNSRFDPFLYGEVEPVGVRQLSGFMLNAAVVASSIHRNLGISKSVHNSKTESKIIFDELFFVDLGSGLGKCVLEMALFCNCHVASKAVMPPTPSLGWDDKSIPVVSAIGIELEPRRAAIATMAWQLAAVTPEQETAELMERIARSKQKQNDGNGNNNTSSDDDDDGIPSENMHSTFGRTIFQRTRLVYGDALNGKGSESFYITSAFPHFDKEKFSLSTTYVGGVFVYCCGVAFDNELCRNIVEKTFGFAKHDNNNVDDKSHNNCKVPLTLLGGVFMFREWPYGKKDADNNKYALPKNVNESDWSVKKIVVATSWMNEAPAFLLCRE